jgi:hypothetical protein
MAFMELVATQAISVRVECRTLPKLFQRGPGLLSARVIRILANRLNEQANARALRKGRLLVGFENAVFERCRNHLDHGSPSSARMPLARSVELTKQDTSVDAEVPFGRVRL